ncbi:MAG: glycosyltransferase family 4 protein [Gemmataceae bacterium]
MRSLRVGFVLPGLGRVQRGAETAFLEVARGLAQQGVEVELFGTGKQGTEGLPTHVVPCRSRETFERWPTFPGFRSETYYEEYLFGLALLRSGVYRPSRFDAVVHCTYPYLNWFLRLTASRRGPRRIFVTQNGDWPCRRTNAEFRWFRCDGLVCTNPEYYQRHKEQYQAALIPNGVDPTVYHPGSASTPSPWDLPRDRPIILIVSAFIASKRVADGIRAAAKVPEAFVAVAGDGPERARIQDLCNELLPGRHRLLGSLPRENMPDLYREADVLLHMSQEEPFGIVYLEGAASGLTVVAHDGPVPRWILGDTALFANTSDLDAVARVLREGIASHRHGDRGHRARQRVLQEWTWDHQAALYRDFLLRLS